MIALVLELYGGVLVCSTVAFLLIVWASNSPAVSLRALGSGYQAAARSTR
jgi:hypothetical protein